MLKIGKWYLVSEAEMEMIQWWLHLLDRHRELDQQKFCQDFQKEQEQEYEETV